MADRLKRTCRRVQAQLPRLIADEASPLRERLADRHLRRCEICSAELQRQTAVHEALRAIAPRATADTPAPPAWLLDSLLEKAAAPDLRARAAGPARGAVSGARPVLTIAGVAAIAVVGVVVGYASWRLGRRLGACWDTADKPTRCPGKLGATAKIHFR